MQNPWFTIGRIGRTIDPYCAWKTSMSADKLFEVDETQVLGKRSVIKLFDLDETPVGKRSLLALRTWENERCGHQQQWSLPIWSAQVGKRSVVKPLVAVDARYFSLVAALTTVVDSHLVVSAGDRNRKKKGNLTRPGF
ncbi:hypothetical protein BHE74_00015954 [Ensete ventricosum]|nr:hypothetical protein BHE74_00015954 [Ensete ventricosum]RZR90577.1 hypothetical protein BHM03_00018492 [Ensete ventricosum]